MRITVARNGLPAARAVVVLLDPDGLELTRGRTATNGRVELPAFDLPAREGPLAIEVNGRPAGETSALAALRFSAAAELLSAPGNPPRLRITVTRYDAPVSGAVVVLLDPEGLELVRGTTTIDGLVELMPFALPTSTGPLAIEVDGRVAEETSVLGPLHAAVRAEQEREAAEAEAAQRAAERERARIERRRRCAPRRREVATLERLLGTALSRVDYTRRSGAGALFALSAAGFRNGRGYLEAVEVLERGEASTARAFVDQIRINGGEGDGGVLLMRSVLAGLGYRIAIADARVLLACSAAPPPVTAENPDPLDEVDALFGRTRGAQR